MADMTYSDSNASVFQNEWFEGRVRVSTSKYADYLINSTVSTDNDYGLHIANNSLNIIPKLMFLLTGDPQVIAAGPSIDDATLQSIVEKNIQKLIPPGSVTPAVVMMRSAPIYVPEPPTQ